VKISVVIPTYNSSDVIQQTLDSVFRQTRRADEVLVMDDGSKDDTLAILRAYQPKITLLQQSNQGVACSRNALVRHANGDLLAFLDHDDIWHPEYLAVQGKNAERHPEAMALFVGHHNFPGFGEFVWRDANVTSPSQEKTIGPLDFLHRYHTAPGPFVSMSFCCIPKSILERLGPTPFHPELSGVDDYFLFHTMTLLGGKYLYDPRALVAYRLTAGAQSASLLKALKTAVRALEVLEPKFEKSAPPALQKKFKAAFAAQRREFGRVLMGTGQPAEARRQFIKSLSHSWRPKSLAKAMCFLALSKLPVPMQPKWPGEQKTGHAAAAARA
jgi:glycosyltransferase involved in cell wall biosynthesis